MEQWNAALVDSRVAWALLGTEFQLENRQVNIEAKDPERNTALDTREAEQVGEGKRPRKEVNALPKPLGRTVADGAHGRGQGVWMSRPTIADKHGKAMDRGGEEAIRETEQQNNNQLVERRTTEDSSRRIWPLGGTWRSWRRRNGSRTTRWSS